MSISMYVFFYRRKVGVVWIIFIICWHQRKRCKHWFSCASQGQSCKSFNASLQDHKDFRYALLFLLLISINCKNKSFIELILVNCISVLLLNFYMFEHIFVTNINCWKLFMIYSMLLVQRGIQRCTKSL